ncbi:MAG: hypothetical protein ACYTE2_00895 [Planctomycetota bacterium]|jgi:hypothetical protein
MRTPSVFADHAERTTMPSPTQFPAPMTLAVLLGVAGVAVAQNALDHNLQRGPGSSRINPAAPKVDYRARNEDVTGTLAGGRSFRGNVGYRASGDFGGQVGADSLQRSLSFSAYSDPSLFNSPLRNEQFRMADGLGIYQYRRQYTALPLYTSVDQVGGLVEQQIRLDRSAAAIMTGNLYSTAVGQSQIGLVRDAEQGASIISASPLRGVRATPLEDPLFDANLTPYDRARVVEEARRGTLDPRTVGTAFRSPLAVQSEAQAERPAPTGLRGGRDERGPISNAVDTGRFEMGEPGRDPGYERIVERIFEQYADREDVELTADGEVMNDLRDRLEELRRNLRGELDGDFDVLGESLEQFIRPDPMLPGEMIDPTEESEIGDTAPETGSGTAIRLPGGTAPLPGLPGLPGIPEDDPREIDPALEVPPERLLSIEEMAEVLRHGRLVERLTEGERTRVQELIEEGQRLIGEGEYFRAERRFESALRIQTDHPMASAGIASAQIGAGLYMSAGLTLRNLFTDYPEMIDTRYAADLLPPRDRLERVAETARERIALDRDLGGYGLLLGFIGHQIGDDAMTSEGVASMRLERSTERLAELVEAIWIADDGDETGK